MLVTAIIPFVLLLQQSPSESPRCSGRCRIDLEYVATLSPADESFALPLQLVSHDGFIFAVSEDAPSEVSIFDRYGHFVRKIGQSGSGLLEFTRIVGIAVDEGGALQVLDLTGRLTRVDTAEVVDTLTVHMRFWGPPALTLLPDGELLINGRNLLDATRVLHVFDRAGRGVRSLVESVSRNPLTAIKSVDVDTDGNIVIAHYDRAGIEVWTADGRLSHSIANAADWWPASSLPADPRGLPAPTSAQIDVSVEHDVVWLLSRIPADHWEQGIQPVDTSQAGEIGAGVIEVAKYYASVMQAFDKDTGALVAERVVQPQTLGSNHGWLARFVDGDPSLIAVRRVGPSNSGRVELWRARLRAEAP